MAEFTPITTQEAFDAAIGARLARERETLEKKYADYGTLRTQLDEANRHIAGLEASAKTEAEKYAGFDKTKAELEAKIKGYESSAAKLRAARENGLPYELADRLTGDTPEALSEDAKLLASMLSKPADTRPAPLASTEPAGVGGKNAGLLEMSHSLRNE